ITGLDTMGRLAIGLPTKLLPMLLVGVSDLTSGAMALLEQHFTAQLTIAMPLWLCIAYYLLLYAWVQYLLARPRPIRV
ncbi:MAG: ComEC family competence protein, partial [Porphyromonas asaccharolytica]